jgi:hypothetical protein
VTTHPSWRPWCLSWARSETTRFNRRGRAGGGLDCRDNTRSIDTATSSVWPRLLQMSPGRGAYSYDWIENFAGLDLHSAESILPEYQSLEVGDVLALGAHGPRS